jgi:prophage antirepressor-like protein
MPADNMDVLQAFVLAGTSYSVQVVLDDDGNPLFKAADVGVVLGLTHVRTSLIKFGDDKKVTKSVATHSGDQLVTFLTERGLYTLLMRSKKPIAEDFQDWVSDVVAKIRKAGIHELERQLDESRVATKRMTEDNTHRTLVEAYKGPNRYVVYFGKIRDEDDGFSLIKIGSTKDLDVRARELKREFGNIKIFKVIECLRNEAFEKFLHKHPSFAKHAYKDVVFEDRRSNEVFRIKQDTIDLMVGIAGRSVNKFKGTQMSVDKEVKNNRIVLHVLQAQNEQIKLLQGTAKVLVASQGAQGESLVTSQGAQGESTTSAAAQVLQLSVPALDGASVSLSVPLQLTSVEVQARRYTQARGPKIQRYSPDGKTLLQTYSSAVEVMRFVGTEPEVGGASRGTLKLCVQRRSVYKGFRWAELERDLPDDTVQDIGDTETRIRPVDTGFVAMIRHDGSILEVFCDQKDASEKMGLKSATSICSAIHETRNKAVGHRWAMWASCSQEQRDIYLTHASLPPNECGPTARACCRSTPPPVKSPSSSPAKSGALTEPWITVS